MSVIWICVVSLGHKLLFTVDQLLVSLATSAKASLGRSPFVPLQ